MLAPALTNVPFADLSPDLQQQAKLIQEINLAGAAESHIDPSTCTYDLWPNNECIKRVLFANKIIYEEHDFDPAYDLDWGDGGGPSDELIAIWTMNAEADNRRFDPAYQT